MKSSSETSGSFDMKSCCWLGGLKNIWLRIVNTHTLTHWALVVITWRMRCTWCSKAFSCCCSLCALFIPSLSPCPFVCGPLKICGWATVESVKWSTLFPLCYLALPPYLHPSLPFLCPSLPPVYSTPRLLSFSLPMQPFLLFSYLAVVAPQALVLRCRDLVWLLFPVGNFTASFSCTKCFFFYRFG